MINPLDYLPPGIEPEALVTGMASVSAFLTVFVVWNTLVKRETGMRRARELATRRAAMRDTYVNKRTPHGKLLSTSTMRSVVDRLKLLRTTRAESVQMRLAQAGWRSNDALIRFLFAKVTLPVLFGIGAVLLFEVARFYNLPPVGRLAVTIGSVLLGFMAPDIMVKNQVTKRAHQIRKGLPDALDLMVICAEAGLSLDSLLKRVSEEFSKGCPELADELAITSLELGFLPDRRAALMNLMNRTKSPGIRGLVNSMLQSDKYGTPLAQSLRVLAHEFREERMLRAEEKAARLPALMTVPMIVFILPPLFVVLIGPAILKVIDALSKM
ncbi:MAG: type II secretion system F family protein [Dongiaceae bacterium]